MRAPARAESGFTLVELMVTVVLLGIVGTMLVSSVVNVQRSTSRAGARAQELGQARVGLEAATADLRTLTPIAATTHFVTATPNEVVFYANRNRQSGGGPVRLRLVREAVDGVDALVRYATYPPLSAGPNPTAGEYPAAATSRRVLARGLVPGQPVFAYLNTVTPRTVAPQPFSAAEAARPKFVEVRIVATAGGTAGDRTELRSAAALVNLR